MTYFAGKNDLRCPVCLLEFQEAAIRAAGIKGCPSCKTALQPLRIREDGYVKVNWQDLRTLAIYAQRWTVTFDLNNKGNVDSIKSLQNILAKLRRYQPESGQALVPPFDAVIVRSTPSPAEFQNPKNVDPFTVVRLEQLKPDHTGLIPSPFYHKKRP